MLPHTKQIVLNVEYQMSPVSVPTALGSEVVLAGVIDYTIVVTNDVSIARELGLYLLVLFSFLVKYRVFIEQSWTSGCCPIHRVGVGNFCCRSEGTGCEA